MHRLGRLQIVLFVKYGRAGGSRPIKTAKSIPPSTTTGSAFAGSSDSEVVMNAPYGMALVEDCLSCKLCSEGFFCHLPKSAMQAFQLIKFTIGYPPGATLFVEGQLCRGIYILCRGRVKLSTNSADGQSLILKIAQAGEVLGLSATISGIPYETTAESGQPCQLDFVKREDFLKFLSEHGAACMHAAIEMSHECRHAYQQLRSFTMSSSSQRIARLILEWSQDGSGSVTAHTIKVALTHDEIAQIIGMSRETVTRTLAGFRKQGIAQLRGSTLQIQNMSVIHKLAGA